VRRREVIAMVGGAAAWPLAARAQQGERVRRIGVLMMYSQSDAQAQGFIATFAEALAKIGWKEGHNLRTEFRWASSDRQLIQRSAKELVALRPDLILSSSTPTTTSLQQETRTIPIIFANIVDPVGSGFATNLSKPGGNITGFINFEFSMGGKWLELLKEIAPRVTRVAALFNPATAPYADKYLSHFNAAAQSIGVPRSSQPSATWTSSKAPLPHKPGSRTAGSSWFLTASCLPSMPA
jgi:ABC-type uncharacterized transport system substrate-binding protein